MGCGASQPERVAPPSSAAAASKGGGGVKFDSESFKKKNGALSTSQLGLPGALSAIREINNKTDGLWDSLLPDTTVVYERYDEHQMEMIALLTARKQEQQHR